MGSNRQWLRATLLGVVAALLLAGCSGKREGPEAQLRSLIKSAVTAAEQKNVGTLRDMISAQYQDDEGKDKRALEALLRVHFLRNESLYLYAHIQDITLPQPDRGRAVVLVAMAGVPIAALADLPALRADLHRFEVDFTREDKHWRVQRAAWRRAEPGEFLGP